MRHGGLTGSYFLAITDPLVVIRSLKPESSGPVTTESFRRGSFGPTSSVPSSTLTQLSQLARSFGDFAGADGGKSESNQWSAPGNRL